MGVKAARCVLAPLSPPPLAPGIIDNTLLASFSLHDLQPLSAVYGFYEWIAMCFYRWQSRGREGLGPSGDTLAACPGLPLYGQLHKVTARSRNQPQQSGRPRLRGQCPAQQRTHLAAATQANGAVWAMVVYI